MENPKLIEALNNCAAHCNYCADASRKCEEACEEYLK